mmetsp:Transcript_56288/g.156817  ORF Transcript_56288/g.156817 Transcript_56288/m.156817 type:complete len:378 (+) Transcript_56288:191-1324(+)
MSLRTAMISLSRASSASWNSCRRSPVMDLSCFSTCATCSSVAPTALCPPPSSFPATCLTVSSTYRDKRSARSALACRRPSSSAATNSACFCAAALKAVSSAAMSREVSPTLPASRRSISARAELSVRIAFPTSRRLASTSCRKPLRELSCRSAESSTFLNSAAIPDLCAVSSAARAACACANCWPTKSFTEELSACVRRSRASSSARILPASSTTFAFPIWSPLESSCNSSACRARRSSRPTPTCLSNESNLWDKECRISSRSAFNALPKTSSRASCSRCNALRAEASPSRRDRSSTVPAPTWDRPCLNWSSCCFICSTVCAKALAAPLFPAKPALRLASAAASKAPMRSLNSVLDATDFASNLSIVPLTRSMSVWS